MAKPRFCFCADDEEEARQFTDFAKATGRTVGTLALIALRQYLRRYAKEALQGKTDRPPRGATQEGTVRIPAGSMDEQGEEG